MAYHSRSRGGRRDYDYDDYEPSYNSKRRSDNYHQQQQHQRPQHQRSYSSDRDESRGRSGYAAHQSPPRRHASYRQPDSHDRYASGRAPRRQYSDDYEYDRPRTRGGGGSGGGSGGEYGNGGSGGGHYEHRRSRTETFDEPSRGRRGGGGAGRYDGRPQSYQYHDEDRGYHPRSGGRRRSPSYDDYDQPPRRSNPNGGPGGKPKSTEMWQAAAKTAFQAGAQAAFRLRNNKGDWVGEKGIQVGAAAVSAGLKDVFSRPGAPSLGGLGGNDSLSSSIRQSLFHEAATKALRKLATKN